jgi:hemolysin activation/secretion protein
MVVISSSVRFIVCRATTSASGGDWLSRLAGRACIAGSILLTVHVPLAKSQTPPQQRLAPAEPQSKPPVQPPFVPVEPPQIEMPRPPEAAPGNADQIKFVLRDVIIEGATIYSTEQLREFYASLVNTEVTLARLFEIAKQIQQKYRTDGYLLARVIVPPQTISDGVFRLQVIEGFIDKVRIEGDIGPAKERVQSFLNKIAERDPTTGKPRPLRERDAERYLLLADDIPGISVFGVLQRGSELGASELVVRAERKWADAYFLFNNGGSKYTGPMRGASWFRENAATFLGESIEALFFAAEAGEQQFGQFAYEQLLGGEGLKFRLAGDYGPSKPGFNLKPLDVKTRSWAVRPSVTYPLIRSRKSNLYLGAGLDVVDQRVDVLGTRLSNDSLRVIHLNGVYDFRDDLRGLSTIRLGLRQGLSILGASQEGDQNLSRQGGDPQFTSVNIYGSRYQGLAYGFGLYLSAAGQYAFNKLLNDELFRVGGDTYGRGYDPSDLSGDSGFGFGAELQYTNSEPLGPLRGYQPYGFYNFGVVWTRGNNVSPRQSIASAGFGVRSQFFEYFFFDLGVAWPLTRKPVTRSDNAQFLFQVTARY